MKSPFQLSVSRFLSMLANEMCADALYSRIELSIGRICKAHMRCIEIASQAYYTIIDASAHSLAFQLGSK